MDALAVQYFVALIGGTTVDVHTLKSYGLIVCAVHSISGLLAMFAVEQSFAAEKGTCEPDLQRDGSSSENAFYEHLYEHHYGTFQQPATREP